MRALAAIIFIKSTMADMADLQRITTEYIETQDRLRLAGELADGDKSAPQVLWLTQRLLQRLLPVLFKQLQGAGAVADTSHADTSYADLLHSFAQQSARAQLVPQPPVQVNPSSAAWLVLSVDIAQSEEGLRLTFKGEPNQPDQQASLALTAQPLRQWLGILHGAYCKAEWPLQVWPQWLQDSSAPAAAPAVVLH